MKIGTINLLHLNSKYVRQGELEITKLFTIENVAEQVDNLAEAVNKETMKNDQHLKECKETAKEAGYRFFVEQQLSNDPDADFIRKMIGDVKGYSKAEEIKNKIFKALA